MYASHPGYHDAGNGPYTHYVDNTAPTCQNVGNGTAAQPRCRLPLNAPAGAVIEVHGGPYGDREYSGDKRKITLQGTAAKPVFLRGVGGPRGDFPVFEDTAFRVYGSYFVLENLILDGTNIYVGKKRSIQVNRVALRNLEVRHHPKNNAVNLHGSDMLVVNSRIHHNYGDDRHGVYIGPSSRNVWILDNQIHHNGGDGIQFCHRCNDDFPEYVYIGGNSFYSNRENGVDLKYARHVVVSQNLIHGHIDARPGKYWCFDDDSYCGVFSSGSDGSSIVVGSDGGPESVIIVFNDIYDSANGIRIEEARDVIVAGNLIRDIDQNALILEDFGEPVTFSNNTLHNVPTGVRQHSGANFEISIRNNIFSSIDEPFDIRSSTLAESIALDNNLFWNGGGSIRFRWVEPASASKGGQFDMLRGLEKQGNKVINPRFRAAGDGNLNLSDNSPAINSAGIDQVSLNQQYQSKFQGHPDILRDFGGTSREGCQIDIGAYEARCGTGDGAGGGGSGGGGSGGSSGGSGDGGGSEDSSGGDSNDDTTGSDGEESPGDSNGSGNPGGAGELPAALEARRNYHPTRVSIDAAVTLAAATSFDIPASIGVTSGEPGDNWLRLSLEGPDGERVCLYQGNGWKKKTESPCSTDNGDAYHFQYCIGQQTYDGKSCGKSPQENKCTEPALPLNALDSVSATFIELGVLGGDRCGDTLVRMPF